MACGADDDDDDDAASPVRDDDSVRATVVARSLIIDDDARRENPAVPNANDSINLAADSIVIRTEKNTSDVVGLPVPPIDMGIC